MEERFVNRFLFSFSIVFKKRSFRSELKKKQIMIIFIKKTISDHFYTIVFKKEL